MVRYWWLSEEDRREIEEQRPDHTLKRAIRFYRRGSIPIELSSNKISTPWC
jgi:hypothetical protein